MNNVESVLKSFLHANRNVPAKTLPWIQVAYILVAYFITLGNDRSMLLLEPGVLIGIVILFCLVRASLLGKRAATVIYYF